MVLGSGSCQRQGCQGVGPPSMDIPKSLLELCHALKTTSNTVSGKLFHFIQPKRLAVCLRGGNCGSFVCMGQFLAEFHFRIRGDNTVQLVCMQHDIGPVSLDKNASLWLLHRKLPMTTRSNITGPACWLIATNF